MQEWYREEGWLMGWFSGHGSGFNKISVAVKCDSQRAESAAAYTLYSTWLRFDDVSKEHSADKTLIYKKFHCMSQKQQGDYFLMNEKSQQDVNFIFGYKT